MAKKSSEIKLNSKQPESFEAGLDELRTLVSMMESGGLSLEDSIKAYQRGSEVVGFCSKCLEKAENEVKVLEKGLLKTFSDEKDSEE